MSGALESAILEVIQPLFEKIDQLTQRVDQLTEVLNDRVPQDEKLWSYSQVAQKLNVKPSTVRSWASRGLIETITNSSGQVRIQDSEVRTLLNNGGRPILSRNPEPE